MIKKEPFFLVGDTESTQPPRTATADEVKTFHTRVWACGFCEIGGKNPQIFTQLDAMWDRAVEIVPKENQIVIFFHNLAWDGVLILDDLIKRGFVNCSLMAPIDEIKRQRAEYLKSHPGEKISDTHLGSFINPEAKLAPNTFKTLISDAGVWYSVKFMWKGREIELRDSLKILPFKVEKLHAGFGTLHEKLVGSIDYTLDRPVGWQITDEEKKYLVNDILVVAEALEKIQSYGLTDFLTIGGFCLATFKKMTGKKNFPLLFPELDLALDEELRESYKGGWCYVNPKYQGRDIRADGYVYDINSMYPYSLSSRVLKSDPERVHVYPVGEPLEIGEDPERLKKWFILWKQKKSNPFFVKIRVDFKIKKDHLPFVQIKKSSRFVPNEYIEKTDGAVTLTLTAPDLTLLLEQYDIIYLEVLKYWVFAGATGLFDSYIDHWYQLKEKATKEGNKPLRQLSKLALVNLYGKFGTNPNANTREAGEHLDKLAWITDYSLKDPVYIPVAAYCTAYARSYIIRKAQVNYGHFMYSDTDSMHLDAPGIELEIHPTKLGAWDNEARFDRAKYVRQKTYIEHVLDEKTGTFSWEVKAAGCPDTVKERLLFEVGMDEELERVEDIESKDYGKVLNRTRTDDDFVKRFDYGLKETGKLSRKSVDGGCVLFTMTFQINK